MSICNRILWGARWGIVFGAAFCALAMAAFLIGGRATFASLDTTLGRILAFYLVGGTFSGMLVGLLQPLTIRPVGAAVTGFICGALLAVLFRVTQDGLTDWTGGDVVTVLVVATVLGIPVGAIYREIFLGKLKKR